MKICHFTSVHPEGDTRIFHRMCRSLAARGHEVILVVAGAVSRNEAGVRIVGVPITCRSRISRATLTSCKVMLEARRQRADVYHFHDPELLPWSLWLRMRGQRVIYDAHEDYIEDLRERPYLPKYGRGAIIRVASMVEYFCARHMSGVVGATDYIADKFASVGIRAIAVRNFPRTDELWRDRKGIAPVARSVVFIGNIMRSRGIIEMIEACRLADVTLILAGEFETPQLRSDARAQPGWSQVRELGHVSRAELVNVLAGCVAGLVLFHPNRNWIVSGPLKLFEYMSAGVPVVASDFPLWETVVVQNGCGFCVDPFDSPAIAVTLRWLCDHPEEAHAMGQRGRDAIARKYNWDGEIEALEAFYARMEPELGRSGQR